MNSVRFLEGADISLSLLLAGGSATFCFLVSGFSYVKDQGDQFGRNSAKLAESGRIRHWLAELLYIWLKFFEDILSNK